MVSHSVAYRKKALFFDIGNFLSSLSFDHVDVVTSSDPHLGDIPGPECGELGLGPNSLLG